MKEPPRYRILIPPATLARAADYLARLTSGQVLPGQHLRAILQIAPLASLSPHDLLGCLWDTKRPQMFAESAVYGDGSDWTLTELGLLGDMSVAIEVEVYDNGRHQAPKVHARPFPATLVFTPGALLANGYGLPPADWREVTTPDGRLSEEGYFQLYERRLLPVLRYIHQHAAHPRTALVTVPGLGCGQFAGPFRGLMEDRLQAVLQRLLEKHGASLTNLKAVYLDPYRDGVNSRAEIHGISYLVRPLQSPGNADKSQLCRPADFAEPADDFADCKLYSVVAWDHVSWPGNDFYLGDRVTDDGVKAAATSSMTSILGVAGRYDPVQAKFMPPHGYRDWAAVVEERQRSHGLRLWQPAALWSPGQLL